MLVTEFGIFSSRKPLHPKKADFPISFTELGMMIDCIFSGCITSPKYLRLILVALFPITIVFNWGKHPGNPPAFSYLLSYSVSMFLHKKAHTSIFFRLGGRVRLVGPSHTKAYSPTSVNDWGKISSDKSVQ